MFADIYFVVHGVTIPAHRVILAARSAYLSQMLHTKWQEKMVFFPRTTEASAGENIYCRALSSKRVQLGNDVNVLHIQSIRRKSLDFEFYCKILNPSPADKF